MKNIFLTVFFSILATNVLAFTDPKVGGVITLKKGMEKKLVKGGALFIYAKQAGPDSGPNDRTPPIAVIKIDNPTFPQAFVLTQKNVMIPGANFQGPFHVIARYSPIGDAIAKAGSLQGFDPKFPSTDLGNKNLNIELNTELK